MKPYITLVRSTSTLVNLAVAIGLVGVSVLGVSVEPHINKIVMTLLVSWAIAEVVRNLSDIQVADRLTTVDSSIAEIRAVLGDKALLVYAHDLPTYLRLWGRATGHCMVYNPSYSLEDQVLDPHVVAKSVFVPMFRSEQFISDRVVLFQGDDTGHTNIANLISLMELVSLDYAGVWDKCDTFVIDEPCPALEYYLAERGGEWELVLAVREKPFTNTNDIVSAVFVIKDAQVIAAFRAHFESEQRRATRRAVQELRRLTV